MGGFTRIFISLSCVVVAVYSQLDDIDSNKVSRGHKIIKEAKRTERQYEDEINKIFEIIRDVVENGSDPLGIPQLDPFKIDNINLNMENSIVSGDFHVSDLEVSGLANFDGQGDASAYLIFVNFNIDFKEPVEFITGYEANLMFFGLVDLYGEGKIKILFKDFHIHTTLKLAVQLEPPFVSEVQELILQLQLPTVDVTITGLYNDEYRSKTISKQLTDTLNDLAENESERVTKILHDLIWPIIEEINTILGGSNASNIKTEDVYRSFILAVIEEIHKGKVEEFPM